MEEGNHVLHNLKHEIIFLFVVEHQLLHTATFFVSFCFHLGGIAFYLALLVVKYAKKKIGYKVGKVCKNLCLLLRDSCMLFCSVYAPEFYC